MKCFALLFVAVLGAAFVPSCASDSAARGDSDRPMKRKALASSVPQFELSQGARQMDLQNEVGVYDSADIEETMAEHLGEVRGCYGRAGRAQRYAGGKVTLRFFVSGNGTPQDVLVIASDLGNYDVERCLVDISRSVKFPPPEGQRPTTFEYPVEFQSTREIEVQDLEDSLKIDRDVTSLMRQLGSCGSFAETGALAILYIEPSGMVGSVGLAAETAVDEAAGSCMVRAMRRWRMSASLPGRMLRCRVSIPSVIAAAEPAPRSTALNSSGRRRRR